MAAVAVLSPFVAVTPQDYHRITSDSLKISSDDSTPIPVGLLACQRDPLLKELTSTIISCVEHQPQQAPSGNKKKKTAQAVDKLYEVILHDTILFPEGGGQPSDIGFLRTSSQVEYEVVEVKRIGGHAVHYVKAKDGQVPGLEAGVSVTAALGDAGYMRRLDHMCMHTSQHLLSALLENHLNLPTLSWALTSYPTPSYVELPRALTSEEISRIQSLAHTLAYEGRKVYVEVEPLGEENRPGVATHESGRSVGKALPTDYTGGVKRTVTIEGVDKNPCCGTHLPSLHNLQLFLLPQTESLSRGSSSTSRLFFLCGPRLHAHLASSHALLTETASLMSCGAPQVPSRVSQVVDERRKADKRVEDLESELARSIGSNLANEMIRTLPELNSEKKVYVKHYHRTDDPSRALTFLQAITSSFLASLTTGGDSEVTLPYILILTSSGAAQTSTSTTSVLVLTSDDARTKAAGDALKAKLGVKGGGRGVRWSGKWTGVWKEAKENTLVEEILQNLL